MNPLEDNIRVLMRGLRELRFDLGPDDWTLAMQALTMIDWENEAAVESALKTIWCRDAHEVPLFSAAFRVWRDLLRRPDAAPRLAQDTYLAQIAQKRRNEQVTPTPQWLMTPSRQEAEADTQELLTFVQGASRLERMASQRLDRLSDEELAQLVAWYAPRRPLTLPSYLPRPSVRGRAWNPGETMRRGRVGSEWLTLYFDASRPEPMPITLLLDMSGSMAGYHRPLLQFAHAMMRHQRRLSVFVFSTRLADVSRPLKLFHADQALAEISDLAPDRGGGTRIADSLSTLWYRHRGRPVRPRSRLVLISDGMEVGGEALADWLDRWRNFLHGNLWWWTPFHMDWTQVASRSLRALAHSTRQAEVSTFAQLNQAWLSLDRART